MLRERFKECLVSLVCGDVQNLNGLPEFFGIVVPVFSRQFDFFVLKVASSNVQRRKSAVTQLVPGKSFVRCFHLERFDYLASSAIYAIIVV